MLRLSRLFTTIIACVVLFGCKAGSYDISYLWKSGQEVRLEELVNNGEYTNATDLILQNDNLINSKYDSVRHAANATINWNIGIMEDNASQLLSQHGPMISANRESWDDARRWMSEVESIAARYKILPKMENGTSEIFSKLDDKYILLRTHYKNTAAENIAKECLNRKRIIEYPLSADIIGPYLEGISTKILSMHKTGSTIQCYENINGIFKSVMERSEKSKLSAIYTAEIIRQNNKISKLDAIRQAKEKGFDVDPVSMWDKVYFVDTLNGIVTVTNKDGIETLKDFSKSNIKKLGKDCLYIVPIYSDVIDVSKHENRVASRYISHRTTMPNPEYNRALIAYSAARDRHNNLSNEYNSNQVQQAFTVDPWQKFGASLAGLGISISLGKAADELRAAQSTLNSTPTTITEPVYQDYHYTVHEIEKKMTTTISLISTQYSKPVYYEINKSVDRKFSIPFGLHKEDQSGLIHYDKPEDIEKFSKSVLSLSLDDLLANAKESTVGILAVKNEPKLNYKKQAKAKPLGTDYTLSDSVVVISTDDNSKGAGFYVSENLILTNAHVIKSSNSISIRNSSNEEALASMVKVDSILDLAVIKTDLRGIPVRFADTKAKIAQGDEVLAVGHPKGLNFSVTRGIISAFREVPNPLNPNRKIKYIQTDTPINSGNSGGPLYRNGSVVGINTFKFVDKEVEGLGFALHYQTIQSFLMSN